MQTGTAIADNDRAAHFGPYRVVREVGRGGAACVYEAEHIKLGKRVAIKAITSQRRPSGASVAHASARLLREGRAAVRLAHPNVVNVFDIAEENGLPYLVMEFVGGGTLAEFLADRAPLATAELIELFMPLVVAVAHAHSLGIVHRDLKPENCLLSYDLDGRVTPKLADFGVCKSLGDATTILTHDDGLLGTLRYMAPEQLRNARTAGPAADQYSLAVMLCVAATGASPLLEGDAVSLMRLAADGKTLLPDSFMSALTPPLRTLLSRALATDETERYPSMRDFGRALLALGDFRTRARWGHWANATGASADSPAHDLSLPGETWSDSSHSLVESIRAVHDSSTPWAKSRLRRLVTLLIAAPVLIICLVWALRASQAPGLTQPRQMSVANVAKVEPVVVERVAVAEVHDSNPPPDPAPARGTTRARSLRKAEPTGAVQGAQREPQVRAAHEIQMGRNGSPILD
ncbi:MAG TPA: serine/threonine-protein kinase [Polyangiaceae bacterium]|jgi:serine/threonine-protein kinase|nr:serine/threonine-protein kinase [Polyangiaceae bacterium]